jgi:hypothetical protein
VFVKAPGVDAVDPNDTHGSEEAPESMASTMFDGLSALDAVGDSILAATLTTLLLGIAVNLLLRARYRRLEGDLRENGAPPRTFRHPVLVRIADDAREAYARTDEPNTQAIVEDHVQSGLGALLLGERFVKAATGLVIILGLLGTFYGLTLSVGKLVHLVTADPGATSDVGQAVTGGLTQALSGMAVAFSNSLVGVASAVILTVLGVFSNVTDRRTAFMVQVEAYLDRVLSEDAPRGAVANRGARDGAWSGPEGRAGERAVAAFGESVTRLEEAVGHFESALQTFATSTRDFREFNLHLKDNVQRMSLSFGDFSEALRSRIAALRSSGDEPG